MSVEDYKSIVKEFKAKTLVFKKYKGDLLKMIKNKKNITMPNQIPNIISEINHLESFCQLNGLEKEQEKIYKKYQKQIKKLII